MENPQQKLEIRHVQWGVKKTLLFITVTCQHWSSWWLTMHYCIICHQLAWVLIMKTCLLNFLFQFHWLIASIILIFLLFHPFYIHDLSTLVTLPCLCLFIFNLRSTAVLSMLMKSKLVGGPQESFGPMITGAWMTLLILSPSARSFWLVATTTKKNYRLTRFVIFFFFP